MKKTIILVMAILIGFTSINAADTVKKDTTKKEVVTKNDTVISKDTIVAIKEKAKSELAKVRKDLLFGGIEWTTYWYAFVFAFIGMFIRWTYKTIKAVKNNPATPSTFSFSHWIKDNASKLMRVFANLALIFIGLRFSNELFGMTLTMFFAFLLGFFLDYVADYLMSMKPEKLLPKVIPTDATTPQV